MTLSINHKSNGYFSVFILPSLLAEFNIAGYSFLPEILFSVYVTPHVFSPHVSGQSSVSFTGFSFIVLPLRLCSLRTLSGPLCSICVCAFFLDARHGSPWPLSPTPPKSVPFAQHFLDLQTSVSNMGLTPCPAGIAKSI